MPTSQSAAPSAQTISVADGSSETILRCELCDTPATLAGWGALLGLSTAPSWARCHWAFTSSRSAGIAPDKIPVFRDDRRTEKEAFLMLALVIVVLSVVLPLAHLGSSRVPRTRGPVVRVLLLYALVFDVGV